jgi:hypothetical protein
MTDQQIATFQKIGFETWETMKQRKCLGYTTKGGFEIRVTNNDGTQLPMATGQCMVGIRHQGDTSVSPTLAVHNCSDIAEALRVCCTLKSVLS